MALTLRRHPDTPCAALQGIEVEAGRLPGGGLRLVWRLDGDLTALRLPPPALPSRADELWRHTCFEAFVRPAGGPGYIELNVAPSRQWAAYRFDDYRRDMAPTEIVIGAIEARPGWLEAEVGGLPDDGPWRLGLSAVIEAADGSLSYWALAHPPGKPDFHHADCFAAELRAPQRP